MAQVPELDRRFPDGAGESFDGRCRRPVLSNLRDASTDTVTRPGAPAMPDARNWRDRVACAAAADAGRAADEKTISQARRQVDHGRVGAGVGLGILVALGAFSGWLTTLVQLGPADGQVNATWTLLVIVAVPWLLRTLWSVPMLLLHRYASPLLGRLVTVSLERCAGRSAGPDATLQDLPAATARRIGSMLVEGSGRRLSAVGSGVFWTAYALAAMTTIWIVTIHVALGFGWNWESSWLAVSIRRGVVEFVAAAVEFPALVLGVCVGSDELTPIAPAPIVPDDDPEAFATRQAWLCALTAGVAVYLLLPMVVWTLVQTVCAHRLAERWRPAVAPAPRFAVTAARRRREPVAAPLRPPSAGGGVYTHVVRLERPGKAVALPAPLDRLADLGDVDAAADLERVEGILRAGAARVAVVGWLPATPDRAVERRLRALASASTETPLLVLDGGDVLRRAEPPHTAATRLDDWRVRASQTGVTPFECDLAELTDASRRSLARAVGHGAGPDDGRGPGSGSGPAAVGSGTARSELDPALLDAAFDVIGRHLDGDDPLPSDAALASCLGEVARTFGARGGGDSPADVWGARLAALRELDLSDVSRRASSLTRTGLGLLPAGLHTRAVWAGVGGLLGVAACAAAAATVAPVALVALPGWATTGAGLAGLLSLVRAGDDTTGSAQAAGAAGSPSDEARRLGEAVFAAAASAVLWWSQGADEARTTRALEVLVSDDTVPTLDGANGARRWLATARFRVVAAAKEDA